MNSRDQERIARNEALFREVNEVIRCGRWPGDEKPAAFRCECALLGCNSMVALTPDDYERIRQNSRQFVLAPGHELPEAETVVELHAEYVVVEKRGQAAAVADALNPRG